MNSFVFMSISHFELLLGISYSLRRTLKFLDFQWEQIMYIFFMTLSATLREPNDGVYGDLFTLSWFMSLP